MWMQICCGLLALVVAAPALTDGTPLRLPGPKREPDNRPWGEESAGLRCRFKAPERLEQGMPLEAEIELCNASERLSPGATKLNRFLADASVELTLLDPQTKASITVRPYDPTLGMPVQDQGKQVERLDKSTPRSLDTSFPLATVWSTLKPGTYQARVRYSFPGQYQKSWWRGTLGDWDAIWKGTVVSAPVTLQILPARQRAETLLLPRRLRLLPGLTIGYTKEDAEKVSVPRRNGFVIGTSIARGAAKGFSLQSGAPKPDDVNPIDQLLGYHGGDKKLSYTITVFETADRAGHMWHPGPGLGDYRELWKKTFDLSLWEKELKASAGAGARVAPTATLLRPLLRRTRRLVQSLRTSGRYCRSTSPSR